MTKSISARDPRRIGKALQYSMQGIAATWRDEPAFKQEVIFFAAVGVADIFIGLPILSHLFITIAALFVLGLELLNSGLEALVDLASPDQHPLAGKAKDCGSAAVLMGLIAYGMIWLVVGLPFLILDWVRV